MKLIVLRIAIFDNIPFNNPLQQRLSLVVLKELAILEMIVSNHSQFFCIISPFGSSMAYIQIIMPSETETKYPVWMAAKDHLFFFRIRRDIIHIDHDFFFADQSQFLSSNSLDIDGILF